MPQSYSMSLMAHCWRLKVEGSTPEQMPSPWYFTVLYNIKWGLERGLANHQFSMGQTNMSVSVATVVKNCACRSIFQNPVLTGVTITNIFLLRKLMSGTECLFIQQSLSSSMCNTARIRRAALKRKTTYTLNSCIDPSDTDNWINIQLTIDTIFILSLNIQGSGRSFLK